MTVNWLTSWWNLIFILPFGLALMYLGLYTLTGLTFGEAEAEVEFDHDVDAHLDAAGHLELDHGGDADLDGDADGGDGDGGHSVDHGASHSSGSPLMSALSWIGIGQMPLSLVMMIQLLCWGAIGFAAVQLMRGRPIGQGVMVGGAAGALGAILVTHFVGSILGPRVFRAPSTVRRWHQLLGSRGEALYPIDEQFGMVSGRDERGEHFQAPCRTAGGQEPIAKGSAVQLVAYAASDRMFYVVASDAATTPRQVRR